MLKTGETSDMFCNTFDAIIQASLAIYLTESMSKETLVKYLVNDCTVPVLDCFTCAKPDLFIK